MFQTQLNRLLMAVIVFNLIVIAGCHRGYYRRQADAEVDRLVREKAVDPRWNSIEGSIEIDPQSRMFNPFSKDHPPIPPDDATSHQLMHRVDGKEGYPHWHANGDTDAVENPTWKAYLPINEDGQVVLTLERAFQLALIHSPDYQQQRETLYRSALNVSLERFGFDSQLFSGYNSFLTTQGRFRGAGSSTTLQSQLGATGGGASLRRLGITGTNFVVGLANTILFNFAGNNTQSANTLIDFSVIQPLLRGAGRERIMESLTQSERTLLANIRQMERFKRGFYLNIAIGRNPGAGPNLGGNFLNNPGSGSTNAGGFYGLLQSQQQIRNQEFNLRQLEGVLDLFVSFYENDRIDLPSLKLFQLTFIQAQSQLLQANVFYETQLDQFKLQLGLPPDLDVVIDDSLLRPFNLISDQINTRLNETTVLRKQAGEALNQLGALFVANPEELDERAIDNVDNIAAADQIPADLSIDEVIERTEALRQFVDKALETLDVVRTKDADQIRADLDKLAAVREKRVEYLNKVRKRVLTGQIEYAVDPNLFDTSDIQTAEELSKTLVNPDSDSREFIIVNGERQPPQLSILKRAENLEVELKQVLATIDGLQEAAAAMEPQELKDYLDDKIILNVPGLLTDLANLPLGLSLIQAYARSNSIEIIDIDLDSEQATRIARCMRRDWMNARANLVDQYRNIEFVADQLEAGVDLVFQGDIGNVGDNPFKLRYETGQLRAGFRFDAPIVRLAERNQYRQALIDYQQTRRQMYQFEDSIKANLRNLLRNVELNRIQFELDRRRVQVSIDNVESNRLELERPVGVGGTGARVGTQTARNLTDAITGLNNSQNSFIGRWVSYEVIRRNLDFDMGTMMLDEMGQWLDPGAIDGSIGVRSAASMGVELDCQFCENIGTSYKAVNEKDLDEMGDSVVDVPSTKEGGKIDALDLYQQRGTELEPRQDEGLTPEQRRLQLERFRQDLQRQMELDRLQQRQQQLELERRLNSPTLEGNQSGNYGAPNGPEPVYVQPVSGQPFNKPKVGPVTSQVPTAAASEAESSVATQEPAEIKPAQTVSDRPWLVRSEVITVDYQSETDQPGSTAASVTTGQGLAAPKVGKTEDKNGSPAVELTQPMEIQSGPPNLESVTPAPAASPEQAESTQTRAVEGQLQVPQPSEDVEQERQAVPETSSRTFGNLLQRFK